MKVIQSLWTKPLFNKESSLIKEQGRFSGGWLSNKYFTMAITLSVLSIKKHYPNIELYTDEAGKKLLIDDLKLPYSKVNVVLDQFNDLPSSLWAIPKVYTYSLQEEPFVHVDNDIFFWDKILNPLKNSDLFVQNFEYLTYDYAKILDYIYKNFEYIPEYLKNIEIEKFITGEVLVVDSEYASINAGIFGGKDINFLKEYTNEVFEIVNKNKEYITNDIGGFINVVLEQLVFYRLAAKRNKQITPLLNTDYFSRFITLVNFEYCPFNIKYIHCLGDFKKNLDICEQVEFRLKYHFPIFYNQTVKYLQQTEDYLDEFNSNKFIVFSHNLNSFESISNLEDVLELSIKLSDSVILNEIDGIYTIEGFNYTTELNNWNRYLIYFKDTSIKGNELLDAVYNSEIINSFDKNFIKENILGIISQHLIYTCFLTIEES